MEALGLFGRSDPVTFTIPEPDEAATTDRLLILYGPNGAGKTTILRGIYHLLSTRAPVYHLTRLARLPVDGLTLTFERGQISLARRADDNEFSITVRPDGQPPVSSYFQWDEVSQRPHPSSREDSVSPSELGISRYVSAPLFVADDRSLESDELEPASGADITRAGPRDLAPPSRRDATLRNIVAQARIDELRRAVGQVESIFRRKGFEGTVGGATSSQGIYVDVIKRLKKASDDDAADISRDALVRRGRELAERGAPYVKYGLISLRHLNAIVDELSKVRKNSKRLPLIADIVEPFFRGLEVQIDSQVEAYDWIDRYVSSVNAFLEHKELRYSLGRGIWIERMGQEGSIDEGGLPEITVEMLSSGEKHLLLLLSAAVLARHYKQIILVDEPELSLGIGWKRHLLEDLLRVTADPEVQIVAASHSVEVINPFRDRVVHIPVY